MTRYRVRLTEEKAREVNRVQKTLEDTNLKLGDVVSDIMGKASRLILHAIADGETDPVRLAALAVGRVRAPQEALEAALTGKVTEHHRFLLGEHLTQIHDLEQAIDRVTAEITRRFTPPVPPEDTSPSETKASATPERLSDSALLPEAPSASQAASSWAQAVVLLGAFPASANVTPLASWPKSGCICSNFRLPPIWPRGPGCVRAIMKVPANGSRGKHAKAIPGYDAFSSRPRIRPLYQKQCYLAEQYRRLAKRRGSKRAALAVAHSILVIIYHLLDKPDDLSGERRNLL